MIELFPLEDYHTIRLPEPIRIGIVSHFIRTGVGNAISIDGLLQLETGHLKFLPAEHGWGPGCRSCRQSR